MKRWAWHFFCAASLLVFAISVGLFVFSWFALTDLDGRSKEQLDTGANPSWYGFSRYHFMCSRGEVRFSRVRIDTAHSGLILPMSSGIYRPAVSLLPSAQGGAVGDISFLGFGISHLVMKDQDITQQRYRVTLPLWLFFLSAIPPWLWWRHRRASRLRGFPITPTVLPEASS